MKTSITLFFTLITLTVFAQLKNASFEEWNISSGWETPDFWYTNNTNGFISVTKTASLTDGVHAMKIISNGPSFERPMDGIALAIFKPEMKYDILEFSYRLDSLQPYGSFVVSVIQYNKSGYRDVAKFETSTITKSTVRQQISLNLTSLDTVLIKFSAKITYGTLFNIGYSEVVVDDIRLKMSTATFEKPSDSATVFYNLSQKQIHIQSDQNGGASPMELIVYDLFGKEVMRESFLSDSLPLSVDVKDLQSGVYVVHLLQNSKVMAARKIVVSD